MAKRTKQGGARSEVIDVLQGGGPIPDKLARSTIVHPDEAFAESTRLHAQAEALRGKLALPDEPKSGQKKTYDELRALTDKLGKRKPALPPFAGGGVGAGGSFGSYSIVATPPYFSAQAVTGNQVGDPQLSSDADQDTGEMSARVVTSNSQESSGDAAAYMALYFRPMFETGTVSIHANMDIDFAWWVNSIGTKDASSRAQGLMRVYIADTFNVVARAAYLGWSITKSQALDFNFGTYPSPSWSLSLPVTRHNYYQLVFSLECSASGVGWIGAIAGSQVALRLSSVKFDFEWTPQVAL